jgi:hypothetical protein
VRTRFDDDGYEGSAKSPQRTLLPSRSKARQIDVCGVDVKPSTRLLVHGNTAWED